MASICCHFDENIYMSKSNFFNIDNLSLQGINEDADLIPLMTPEDEEEINREELPEVLPILPLKNTVLFPGVVIPITAGRDASIKLINDANNGDKTIGVVAQKDSNIENPEGKDLHQLGVVAKILRVLKMPDGNTTVIIQGKKRFQINEVIETEPYIKASVSSMNEVKPATESEEFLAILESIKDLALQIIKDSPTIPSEASFAIKNISHCSSVLLFC